ncbi:MAG: protein-disulfide isomerase [Planctomycetota bacterium]
MSIDTYSICPCGSGKKIKFCKCKDSVHELDKVLKMIEGGQLVPALDRLSSILDQHPDAAWALAIRGRLLMDLREYAALEENAQRFRRLQPSNPLAIVQSAASALFRQDLDGATELVLEALTESGQSVDSFVLDVASLLAYALAGNGIALTARVYATLALASNGYEDTRLAASVLQQLNGDPQINLLAKSTPTLIPRPSEAAWGERYDEAASLLANNKVSLAETKFDSLQRSAPMQPAVLSGLLNCAVWRGDHIRQSELLTKLSQCDDLTLDDRARYLAMASAVSPSENKVSLKQCRMLGEFESIDEANMALMSHSRFANLPAETLAQFKEDEGVVPKAGFQLLDRDQLDGETPPTVDNAPVAIALVLLYGKQTDRNARIEVLGVPESTQPDVQSLLTETVGQTAWNNDDVGTISLAEFATPRIAGIPATGMNVDQFEALQNEVFAVRAEATLLDTPVALLGGANLTDAASDPSMNLPVAAFLRFIEGEDALTAQDDQLVERLYRAASCTPPSSLTPTGDELEEVPNDQLNRVDVSGLDLDGLVYLIQRTLQVSATLAGRKAADVVLTATPPSLSTGADDERMSQAAAKMVAYSFMIQRAGSSAKTLQMLEKAREHAEANEMNDASLWLAEASLRARRGEFKEFEKCIQSLMSKHGQNPEVVQRVQQLLVQLGLVRPDGTPMAAPPQAAAESSPSGLWTPDSGSPTAAPVTADASSTAGTPTAASAGGNAGGGKLWVPGMD